MSELSSLVGQHFAFAHGRLGVLKQLLMSQSDVDRLLGTSNVKAVEQVLIELKMTDVIDQGIHEGHAILHAVAAWMRSEVEHMAPPSKHATFHILWLEGDAPLLAYLIKDAKNLTSSISREPAMGMTAYDPDALKRLTHDGDAGTLPSHLVEFVRTCLADESMSVREVDDAVAQFVAGVQRRLARASGSGHIKTYVSHRIDLTNIRTAVRMAKQGLDINSSMIEGGSVPVSALTGSVEDIARSVGASSIGYMLPDNLEAVLSDPIAFEQAAAHITANDVSKMWNVPLSLEPVFAFAAIAVAQLRLVRTVLIAKANELSPQQTKAVLPPFLSSSSYVS